MFFPDWCGELELGLGGSGDLDAVLSVRVKNEATAVEAVLRGMTAVTIRHTQHSSRGRDHRALLLIDLSGSDGV